MADGLYIEMNLFCIVILVMILVKTIKSSYMRKMQIMVIRLLADCIVLFSLDILWNLRDAGILQVPRFGSYLIDAVYFIWSGLVGYRWFVCSEILLQTGWMDRIRNRMIAAVPLLCVFVLSAASWWTDWIFYLDSAGGYHRGKLYIVHIILNYGYIVVTAARALYNARKEEHFVNRSRYVTIASFTLYPFLLGVLQIFFPDIPGICMGVTLAFLNVYFDFQQQQISRDSLTQMNNRDALKQFLASRIALLDEKRKKHLYLVILDIRGFKKINEIFGWEEGDRALICVADTLKKLCINSKYFVCRYGSDSFGVVYEDTDAIDVGLLCRSIQKEVNDAVAEKGYSIEFQMGYAEYDKKMSSVREYMQAANKNLRDK